MTPEKEEAEHRRVDTAQGSKRKRVDTDKAPVKPKQRKKAPVADNLTSISVATAINTSLMDPLASDSDVEMAEKPPPENTALVVINPALDEGPTSDVVNIEIMERVAKDAGSSTSESPSSILAPNGAVSSSDSNGGSDTMQFM